MAQRTLVTLVDDLDGSSADTTVTFSLNGVSYEMDLTNEHVKDLEQALARFIESARRTGGRQPARRSRTGRNPANGEDPKVLREWARQNGLTVSERGRVSTEVREAYRAAQK